MPDDAALTAACLFNFSSQLSPLPIKAILFIFFLRRLVLKLFLHGHSTLNCILTN